jgi:uncharacterized protein DUF4345
MEPLFANAVLFILSAFALLTAYSAFRAPKRFAAQIGFEVPGADGLNEVRAQYGGFYLLVAIVGALALAGKVPVSSALLLTTVIFAGLILGRTASLVIDGGFKSYRRPTIRALYLIDSVGVVISGAALSASML